jgi:predicted RNase H-like HicB family nuclease
MTVFWLQETLITLPHCHNGICYLCLQLDLTRPTRRNSMTSPLRVVVLKDGDIFVAQCLEIDVAAQGATHEEAMERLKVVLRAEEAEAKNNGKELVDLGPAPNAFHAIYGSGSIARDQLKMVA